MTEKAFCNGFCDLPVCGVHILALLFVLQHDCEVPKKNMKQHILEKLLIERFEPLPVFCKSDKNAQEVIGFTRKCGDFFT